MRYAICNETFEDWEFEKICDFASKIGYNGLEIAPFTLAKSVEEISSARRSALRRCIEKAGLETVGLHWLLTSPAGLYINHPEETVRERTIGYLKSLVHFCADLGGELLIFGSPKQRSVYPGLEKETAWKYAIEGFQACMKDAESRDVTLAIEPLAPSLTDVVTSAQEGLRMVQEVGHPNFRLHLDVYSMCSELQPIEDIIRSHAGLLAHFHANDSNLRGPGFGEVDYEPIARAIKDIGYNGYISVEVFDYKPDPETIAVKSLEFLRRFFD